MKTLSRRDPERRCAAGCPCWAEVPVGRPSGGRPGVDSCRMLDFEGPRDRSAFEPEDVDLLDRSQGRLVVVQRQDVDQRPVLGRHSRRRPIGRPSVARPEIPSSRRIGASRACIRVRLARESVGRAVDLAFRLVLGHRDRHDLIWAVDLLRSDELLELLLIDGINLASFLLGEDERFEESPSSSGRLQARPHLAWSRRTTTDRTLG